MVRRLMMVLALAVLVAGSAGAAAKPPVLAQVHAGGAAVDWSVLVDYQKGVLTVSMPDGTVSRSEFAAGGVPTFSAFDKKGEARPAGTYQWELRLTANVGQDTLA